MICAQIYVISKYRERESSYSIKKVCLFHYSLCCLSRGIATAGAADVSDTFIVYSIVITMQYTFTYIVCIALLYSKVP